MPKTFGETIREARRNKRLTAGEFAKKIGITQSALSKLENNQAKKVDPELVKRICKVLYIDANQLFNIEANVTYNYEENIIYPFKKAEELKNIRAIYETISFDGDTIKYFDYIAQVHKCVNEKNSVEIQYMIMNLYTRAYAESVMWLKKEDPTGQWCPATPWQLLIELKLMIQNYFFY